MAIEGNCLPNQLFRSSSGFCMAFVPREVVVAVCVSFRAACGATNFFWSKIRRNLTVSLKYVTLRRILRLRSVSGNPSTETVWIPTRGQVCQPGTGRDTLN